MNKRFLYRVIVYGAKLKGLQSSFAEFSNDLDARSWAVAYGRKLLADRVDFSKKSNVRYNHYNIIDSICLSYGE